MLGQGLYRVKAVESLSINFHMGMQGTIATGSTGTTLVIDIDESDEVFSSTTNGFQLPAGTKILCGDQGFNNPNQVLTLASRAEFGRAVGTVTVSGTATNGKILTIVSADGTSKSYLAASSEDLTTDPCKFKSSGSKQLVAESIVNCINDVEGGHGGKIKAELDLTGTDPVIRLVQLIPGTDGNKTMLTNEANIATSDFTGGKIGTINATTEETLVRPIGEEVTVFPSNCDLQWRLLISARCKNFWNLGKSRQSKGHLRCDMGHIHASKIHRCRRRLHQRRYRRFRFGGLHNTITTH